MPDVKTVDGSVVSRDPLIQKQKEDVAKMRASLLTCSENPSSVSETLRNITVMRVYHHLSRIIRYTEMMDKIEEKLYECIDYQLENMNTASNMGMVTLLSLQEKLQKNLIDSQKLLQPYIDLNAQIAELEKQSLEVAEIASNNNIVALEDRDKLRSLAQAVISELNIRA